MLRTAFLAIFTLLSIAVPARADPQLNDDLTACRDRQSELKTRLVSCEKLIAGGTLRGRDLAIALNVRGNGFMARRDIDRAITAYNAALDADPDNSGTLVLRGWAYQRKGQDDQAMADYNLALQKHSKFRRGLQRPRYALSAQGGAAERAG